MTSRPRVKGDGSDAIAITMAEIRMCLEQRPHPAASYI
jgi:hypothetical protein